MYEIGVLGNTILSIADPHLTVEAGSGIRLSLVRIEHHLQGEQLECGSLFPGGLSD